MLLPPIFQVDAFTDRIFKGNPAGVMLLKESLSEESMRDIAMEMNLSETAFVQRQGTEFDIRYFTPLREVPLCGHATLGSAHILYEQGIVGISDKIRFRAPGGTLSVFRDKGEIGMEFPRYPIAPVDVPKEFETIVGFRPLDMYASSYDWLIAVAESEDDVANARPRFEAMTRNGLGHLMITAKARTVEADFVVRCFAPSMGVDEDPVTGSAQCALGPLWAARLGLERMIAVQLSKRTGKLRLAVHPNSVTIYGQARTVFKANWHGT